MDTDENAPESITCQAQVLDVCFHPTSQVLAASTVAGCVEVWRYSPPSTDTPNVRLLNLTHHTESVRRVVAVASGETLLTGSADRSIAAVSGDGQVKWHQANAHPSPVNCLLTLGDNVLVSGDENGEVKVWDLRDNVCVAQNKEHQDFISDMVYNESKAHLLTAGGDGTLGVFDLRKPTTESLHNKPKLKFTARSDGQDDELLSLAIMKHGSKVVAGTQEGVLDIFSYGQWGDISDRLPGHPDSIDAILKVDEQTICTGSSDGVIRVVSIFPNKLLGVIGDHDNFPVERMRFSPDSGLIATCSHDEVVRFWDVSFLAEELEADRANGGSSAFDAAEGGGVDHRDVADTRMNDEGDDSMDSDSSSSDSSGEDDDGAGGAASRRIAKGIDGGAGSFFEGM